MIKSKYENNEELIKLARSGDINAEEELLLANDKLCFYTAKKFQNTKIDIDDLASLARIGLYKAYKTYKEDKNIKFATYASRVMANEILMEIRRNKKHRATTNLENIVSTDFDGKELSLIDVIPAPEDRVNMEDSLFAQEIFKVFCESAKDRDIEILKRCIIGEERQRDVGKELGISQTYVSRIITSIEKRLQHIAKSGKYVKVTPGNIKKKEGKVVKKARRYTKSDYVYAFKNYPQLSNKEIGYIMGVVPQSVVNYRADFKKGAYDNLELVDISKELVTKLDDFIKNREEKAALEAASTPETIEEKIELSPEEEIKELEKVRERIDFEKELDEAIVRAKLLPEKNYKKEEISNNEIIILNNKISLMSNISEVSSLIYGIYQLLENSPQSSRVKIDLSFEVIK